MRIIIHIRNKELNEVNTFRHGQIQLVNGNDMIVCAATSLTISRLKVVNR